MRAHRRTIALSTLALLLAAGLGAWQGHQRQSGAMAGATQAEAAPAAEVAPAPALLFDAPPVPELPDLPPLPPTSMRLGEAWPALEARALAGDWRAGCRLASGLTACAARDDAMLRGIAADAGLGPALAALDCADVPASLRPRRALYRLAAAQAGHRASAEAFVAGLDFPHAEPFALASEPALLAYREHHTALRMALLELGSFDAALHPLGGLWRMRGDGPTDAEDAAMRFALQAGRPHAPPSWASERVRRWLSMLPADASMQARDPLRERPMTPTQRASALRMLGAGDPTCPGTLP